MYAAVVSTRTRTAWLGITAALATGLPLLAFVWRFGIAAPVSLFQADAFYYLDITRNSAGHPGFTFDGTHQTNGFHPLWQWLLSFSRWLGLLRFADPARALLHVYFLDVALLSLGAGLLTCYAAQQVKQPALALLVTAPGLIWFLSAPISPAYLSTWSYANGMESALSLSMMALALLLYDTGDATALRDLACSGVLGLAVLARLDDVFFFLAISVWAAFFRRLAMRRLLLLTVPAAAMIAAYVVYNRLTVGAYLPLSGTAKAGLAIVGNLGWAGKLFIPMLTRNAPSALGSGTPDAFFPETIRAFQMVVPPLICLAELWAARRSQRTFGFVQALCIGVILKAIYNFFLVAGHSQGLWYYTVSIAVSNLVLVLWIDRIALRFWPEPLSVRYWAPAYTSLAMYSFSVLYGAFSTTTPAWPIRLLRQGPAIAAQLERGGDHCFTELDDGFTSYALHLPAEAGLGLALDLQATEAARQGRLLPLLRKRGCGLLIASPVYSGAVQSYLDSRAWQQGVNLFSLQAREFQAEILTPAGTIGDGDLVLFRMQARISSPIAAEPSRLGGL